MSWYNERRWVRTIIGYFRMLQSAMSTISPYYSL